MSATDFENESLNYFSNKYPNLACAWTTGEEKWGLTAVQLWACRGSARMVIAASWTNWSFYEINGNLFVDLEMELTHILIDSSFLSLGFPYCLSLCLFGSQTQDTILENTNKKEADEDKKEQVCYLGRSGMR